MDDLAIASEVAPAPLTISLATFIAKIERTSDFVYAKLLKLEHARSKFSEQGWRDALDVLRSKPV